MIRHGQALLGPGPPAAPGTPYSPLTPCPAPPGARDPGESWVPIPPHHSAKGDPTRVSWPSATLQGTGIQNIREKCLKSAWEEGQI